MKQKISELEQQRFSYLLNKQYDEFAAMCDADLHYVHSSGVTDDLFSYLQKLKSGLQTVTENLSKSMYSYLLTMSRL